MIRHRNAKLITRMSKRQVVGDARPRATTRQRLFNLTINRRTNLITINAVISVLRQTNANSRRQRITMSSRTHKRQLTILHQNGKHSITILSL